MLILILFYFVTIKHLNPTIGSDRSGDWTGNIILINVQSKDMSVPFIIIDTYNFNELSNHERRSKSVEHSVYCFQFTILIALMKTIYSWAVVHTNDMYIRNLF